MKNVLVIAAHPDDEVIGCGGTIAKHKRAGDKIHLLYMTDGISSRGNIEFQQKNIREVGVKNFIDYLKPESNKILNLPDNSMDSISLLEIVKEIESVISDTKPDIIYTHSAKDLNIDHRITLEATLVATRPQNSDSVKEVYSFFINSSSEWNFGVEPFKPNLYVDITDEIAEKEKFLAFYADEMRAAPHARSISNIINTASVNGATVGVKFAEVFEILRECR